MNAARPITGPTDEELTEATVQEATGGELDAEKFWAGPGWYAWYTDYPDEGSWHFDHEPTDEELRELGLRRASNA